MAQSSSRLTYRITLALAIIFFIFSAVLFYVNKIFLPIQAKDMAIKAAQEALHRQVTFNTLQFSPLQGFVITDLVISQKDDPSKLFIRAKRVSAQVLFLALWQKQVIIPALNIESPEIFVTRLTPRTWDLSDLITPAPPNASGQVKGAKPLDLVISGFSVNNAQVSVTDISMDTAFHETISFPLLKGSLSLNGAFLINGSMALASTSGTLSFDTRIGLNDHSFKGDFTAAGILLSHYLRFAPPLPVTIKRLSLTDTHITVNSHPEETLITGNIALPGIDMALADNTQIRGDIAMTKATLTLNKNGMVLQSTLAGNNVAVTLPSGPNTALTTLRAPNLQAQMKNGRLNIKADINTKGLSVQLNDQQALRTDVDIRDLALTQNDTGYTITGHIDAADALIALNETQRLGGRILLDRTAISIAGNTVRINADVDIKNTSFTGPNTSVTAHISAPETRLSWNNGTLDGELKATFNDLVIKAQDITAAGTPQLAARLSLDPKAATPLNYAGELKIPSLTITGLPNIGTINNIHGDITFAPDVARTQNMVLTVMGTPIAIAGEMTRFNTPQLDLTARAEGLNLNIIEKIIPAIIKDQGLNLDGTVTGSVHFQGSPTSPETGKISAIMDVANARVESKKLGQTVSAINGHFEYKAPSLTWQDLSLEHQNRTWHSNGSLHDLTAPAINAFVKTEDLSADIDLRKENDTITINALKGAWFDSNFSIKGTVLAKPSQAPVIDINSDIKLTLRDLPKMLPADKAKQVDALKLAGILKIKNHVRGIPQQWQDLVSSTSIDTPALYMLGYQIADLTLDAHQNNGLIERMTLTGKLYGGGLKADATLDLKAKGLPFTLKAVLENLDLDLLRQDTPLRQQQLAGLMSASMQLEGGVLDIRQSHGQGMISITKGYLWQLEILSKIMSIISSSFQGGNVIITDASATFKVADQKVMTTDLALRGTGMSLLGEGWIDFDQNIDLNITPRLEAPPAQAGGTVNPLEVINPTAGILNIRVYGPLSAPKFEHNLSAPQILKKTLQNTVGSIFKLFE